MTLKGGPAAGSYVAKRAPMYLRAVLNRADGAADVLDQLEDTPADSEDVSVYQLQGDAGAVHLNFGGGRNRKGPKTGFYARATYHHREDVDGDLMRVAEAWRAWVSTQVDGDVDLDTGVIAERGSNIDG